LGDPVCQVDGVEELREMLLADEAETAKRLALLREGFVGRPKLQPPPGVALLPRIQ